MSSFTDQHKNAVASLDGPNDLRPEVKTSRMIALETPKAKKTKKTTTTKSE